MMAAKKELLHWMPYRILCNGVLLEHTKANIDLAFELSYYVAVLSIRYGDSFLPLHLL